MQYAFHKFRSCNAPILRELIYDVEVASNFLQRPLGRGVLANVRVHVSCPVSFPGGLTFNASPAGPAPLPPRNPPRPDSSFATLSRPEHIPKSSRVIFPVGYTLMREGVAY